MKEVPQHLADRKITVELTEAARSWLAEAGFDPMYGARQLRRTIQRQIENSLSKKILQGEFKEGDSVVVDATAEGLVFTRGKTPTEAAAL